MSRKNTMESRKTAGNNKLSFIGLGCWRFGEPESTEPVNNPGNPTGAVSCEKIL